MPSPRDFDADYDAIFNVERLETLGPGMRVAAPGGRVLADRGTIVVQMAVATPLFDDVAGDAVDLLRSYIWPRCITRRWTRSAASSTATPGCASSAKPTWPPTPKRPSNTWRGLFVQHAPGRGPGYDRVYRRLWEYNLSLQQALLATSRLDVVQLELVAAPPVDANPVRPPTLNPRGPFRRAPPPTLNPAQGHFAAPAGVSEKAGSYSSESTVWMGKPR